MTRWQKGGGDVASGPARWLGLVAFVLLLAFGLVLLFVPDLAEELDERTGGQRAATVTVTEAKRTSDSESSSEGRSVSGRRGRARGRQAERTRETDRQQSTQTTTSTTTTERTEPGAGDGVLEETLGVPAVAVVARTALVALLAALVAWALMRLWRPTAGSSSPAASENPAPSDEPAETLDASPSGAAAPEPAAPAEITVADAEAARASVVDGIPLLREVFAARGEPSVDTVLPDMRVGVQLTETLSKEQPLPVSLFARDAALALAAFRTEIEQRLRRLARDEDLQCAPSVDAILHNLTEEGLFEDGAADGFRDLLRLAQRGLHGNAIDPEMVNWVTDRGVPLLLSLDLMLPT